MRKKLARYGLFLIALMGTRLTAEEVTITTPAGENYILDISNQETFFQVADKIQEFASLNNNEENFIFEVVMNNQLGSALNEKILPVAHRNNTQGPRNFYSMDGAGNYVLDAAGNRLIEPLTAMEMQDIRFIITTLANKSLATIYSHKSALEASGDRIDHLHPLRFLWYVFTEEELKVGIHNIRNKKWVWKDFSSGIKESLNNESGYQNMREEYISTFANRVEVNSNLIMPSVLKKNWDELLDVLITHVPRKGDHRRYDN